MKDKTIYFFTCMGTYLCLFILEYALVGFLLLLINDSVLIKFILLAILAVIINPILVYRLVDYFIDKGIIFKHTN